MNARAWLAANRRPLVAGALVGVGAAALFLALHAVVVQPIWDAWPRALFVALYGGALVGLAHARVARLPRWRGGGWALGALAALWLAPFLVGGALRTAGQPLALWVGALAALVLAWAALASALVRRAGGGGIDVAALALAVALLNALPAVFLTFITNFHELPVQPVPMTLVLAGIYVVAGGALSRLAR